MGIRRGDRSPVPLVATGMEVEIEGGIVVASTRRVFRNVEAQSIEATLTFPDGVINCARPHSAGTGR